MALARREPMWAQPLPVPECPEGWVTGPPDFVGVGAQRCGTSWWFRGAIRPHPQVSRRVEPLKEVHFFDRWWLQEPPPDLGARYAELFPRPPGRITGEWTPRYMCDPWAVRMLAEAAPETRILIMLRDPVARYLSGIAREARHAEQAGIVPSIAVVGDALYRSLYRAQVERILQTFGRDRVLILQHERCLADPLAEMQRTHRFLGVEPLSEPPERLTRQPKRRTRGVEIGADMRADLVAMLRDDVLGLAELCPELRLDLWPSFADLAA